MDGAKRIPLDEKRLTPTSRELLKQILAWNAEWIKFCAMDEAPYGCDLVVEAPSPTGDTEREITIWFARDAEDISIAFAGWHCHGTVTAEIAQSTYREWPILEALKMIVAGKLGSLVTRAEPDLIADPILLPGDFQLTDALTAQDAPQKVYVRTWDGAGDRVFSLADLKRT